MQESCSLLYLAPVCLQWWRRRPGAVPVQHPHPFALSFHHAKTLPYKIFESTYNSEWCCIRDQICYTVNKWFRGLKMIRHAGMNSHQGCIPGRPDLEPQQQQDTAGWTLHRKSCLPRAAPSPGMPCEPKQNACDSFALSNLRSLFHTFMMLQLLKLLAGAQIFNKTD